LGKLSARLGSEMTLNQTIVSRAGIWQCSDHRLVNPGTGEVVDDYSIKHAILRCTDGSALLAYAGVGRVGSVDISDWIRETMRGESRTVDQTLVLLRKNATRDLASRLLPHGIVHMFSIGAFLGARPWAVQIRNFNITNGAPEILDCFETVAREITADGQGFIFDPSGRAVTPSDRNKLLLAATKKPRDPEQFSKLMARINHRASQTAAGSLFISSGCVTTYIPPSGEPFSSKFYGEDFPLGKPAAVPTLLFGIDLTEIQRVMLGRMPGDQIPEPEHTRAASESVIAKNRIRGK
jgi:hypothetical protein